MLKIRLTKVGSKNERKFRIVATPARSKRNGKFLEILGYYQPDQKQLRINQERYNYWLKHGAQPTKTIMKLVAEKK